MDDTEKGRRKIEKEIAKIIKATNPFLPEVEVDRDVEAFLALISSVECGDCEGTGEGRLQTGGSAETDIFICETCKGTGFRKVMVRRGCPDFCPDSVDTDVCVAGCPPDIGSMEAHAKGPCTKTTLFSPADLIDLINKSATLVLEEVER